MKKAVLTLFFLLNCILGFSQDKQFNLQDFYKYNSELEHKVHTVFQSLNDSARVSQMIVTSAGELGKDNATVKKLVQQNKVGGVIYLKGTKKSHKSLITDLNSIASKNKQLPLLHSMDAEPGLLKGRIKGSQPLPNAIDIKNSKECDSVVNIINKELLSLGIRQNFAPVVDISPNNEAIKSRSFGSDKNNVIKLSKAFINSTQKGQIIGTAKHFPGHGLVKGDTHKQSVYIDGELQELDIYKPLINADVLSIMIAHITVKNNDQYATNGLPASCSKNIVTNLLKDKLNFKGLIITDAMNIMKAVTYLEDAPLKASKAGCDMILMPIDEVDTQHKILAEMNIDAAYKAQVYQSVKKIIRLKICLGLL
ncbi:glycoside hydrolase family 3 N-terminal domain-containing protein [Tenacibaculum holothuriorum]|uniref:glycoside hydrolase family 3 N-terminal domain-containing protein n=1 Tax=Tenacibaculum holothuriorum TaxID=1635173 RepID=UPI000A325AC1|nr:glycoside hydrolase family 3 N-terminal domain-containing protein [Tenacibaculum holothuriorum]